MAAHELGQRMHDDVGAMTRRLQEHRRRHRVVDNQRHAARMRHARDCLKVTDIAGRIADGLAEHRGGIFIHAGGKRLSTVAGGKAAFHALPRQNRVQQGMGGTVKLRHRNDILPGARDIGEGVVQRRLSRRGR